MSFETETALLLIIARILHLGISLGLFGVMVSGLVLDQPTASRGQVIRLALGMGASGVMWLWCVAASLGTGWQEVFDPMIVWDVLIETWFGRVWFWRLVLIAVLLAAALCHGAKPVHSDRGMGPVLLMVSGALLVLLALTGHAAMGQGWSGVAQRVNHATHLAATACWLGGLWPLSRLLGDARRGMVPVSQVGLALHRFSQMGVAAVMAVLVSGMINFFILTDGDLTVLTTTWGLLLCGKLVLVVCLLALALFNRFRLLPRLAAQPVDVLAALHHAVQAEMGFGLVLLGLVSWLGTTAPSL